VELLTGVAHPLNHVDILGSDLPVWIWALLSVSEHFFCSGPAILLVCFLFRFILRNVWLNLLDTVFGYLNIT